MRSRKTSVRAVNLEDRCDRQQQEEHDFCNLLREFQWAIERQDRRMMDYCDSALKEMFWKRRQQLEPTKKVFEMAARNCAFSGRGGSTGDPHGREFGSIPPSRTPVSRP
jgi:hypothetical protein